MRLNLRPCWKVFQTMLNNDLNNCTFNIISICLAIKSSSHYGLNKVLTCSTSVVHFFYMSLNFTQINSSQSMSLLLASAES